jgi:hypothetical protein
MPNRNKDHAKQEQRSYQTARGRKIDHTQTPRSVGATGLCVGCREADEACQIDQVERMYCRKLGHFDTVEGLRVET